MSPNSKQPVRQEAPSPVTMLMLGLIGLSLAAACSQPAEEADEAAVDSEVQVATPEAPPAKNSNLTTAEIDWASARADFAADQSEDDSDTVFSVQSGGTLTPIPILLPDSDTVTIQSADNPGFRLLADGYYASYPGPRYTIIINGTNLTAGKDGETRSARDGQSIFTETMTGAQIALSRYGADYLIEFECVVTDPDTGTCIDETEARRVAEALIVAGTR